MLQHGRDLLSPFPTKCSFRAARPFCPCISSGNAHHRLRYFHNKWHADNPSHVLHGLPGEHSQTESSDAEAAAHQRSLWMRAIKPPMYCVGYVPVLVRGGRSQDGIGIKRHDESCNLYMLELEFT